MKPANNHSHRGLGPSGATLAAPRAPRGSAPATDLILDETERVARIGSYSLEIPYGRWVSSKGLNAILITDLTPTIEYANPAFERLSGLRRQDVVGGPARLLGSAETPAVIDAMWRTVSAGGSWSGDLIHRRLTGQTASQRPRSRPSTARTAPCPATSQSSAT